MGVKPISLLSVYSTELLRLVFAEDRAALYIEGFSILSSAPAATTVLKRLQDETNLNIVRVLELFRAADPEMEQESTSLENAVALELTAHLDIASLDTARDTGLIRAAARLEDFLLLRYRKAITISNSLGLKCDCDRLQAIYRLKAERRESLEDLLKLAPCAPVISTSVESGTSEPIRVN